LLKKVVVLFPYPPHREGTLGQKTYESKEGELSVYNTDKGDLVLQDHVGTDWTILAVFKDWIYWEKIE